MRCRAQGAVRPDGDRFTACAQRGKTADHFGGGNRNGLPPSDPAGADARAAGERNPECAGNFRAAGRDALGQAAAGAFRPGDGAVPGGLGRTAPDGRGAAVYAAARNKLDGAGGLV